MLSFAKLGDSNRRSATDIMDSTAPSIGISREEFVENLVASRLFAQDEMDQFSITVPAGNALELANALIAGGALTEYQLDAITGGRAAELRIGNYDILDKLGVGGMGTVFKARHRKMKRVVALKVLSAALCKDTAFVRRFQREVETIARLGHPNVVMAFDADEAEVGHFLVMEFVNGRDLTSFVEKNHPVGVGQAVDCVIQAARGLGFAHSQGVIHRDIKPANLLRDNTGVVKVTDLGLARLSSTGPDSPAASGLTQAGAVMGSVHYMAPEQAVDSTTVDHRADIYSLGATLYFLLAGQPPYNAKTVMAILLKHRDEPIPPLANVRPDVPAELDAVYHRMMAKDAAQRYQSMAEVIAALEAIAPRLGGASAAPPLGVEPMPTASAGSSVVLGKAETQVTPGAANRPTSVVVVEPSRVQGSIIRKYLESQEITAAAIVGTGAAALAAVREFRPDAVVSALHLSDTTGVELAKRIREEFKDSLPGIVLISSEADGNDPSSLSRLDRVVVLPKPFSPEQLVQSLSVVTGKSIAVKATAVSAAGIAGLPGSRLAAPKPKSDRSALRVLIVDDSGVARTNEKAILAGLGFAHFSEAADGAQAIASATRDPFDLIVTDYNMPLMDGRALVSYLKQTPSTAEIPIVMVTTETSATLLDEVRKLGVVAIFDKTFAAAAVKPVLDKLFG
jgi:serine/threonine protein kinase